MPSAGHKIKFFRIITAILSISFLGSCSVEKRHYMSGYHLSKKSKPASGTQGLVKKETISYPKTEPVASSSNDLSQLGINSSKRVTLFDSVPKKQDCDSIFFRTGGDKIAGKLVEINTSEVKYRKCSNPDGPLFIVKKSDVIKVKYANGTEELISSSPAKENTVVTDKPRNQDKRDDRRRTENTGAKTDPLAVMSMVFGIISMPLGLIVIGGIFGALAVVFGNLSKKKIRENPDLKGIGMAKTGITLGYIGFGIALLILLILVA
jgi:hypothetical protein